MEPPVQGVREDGLTIADDTICCTREQRRTQRWGSRRIHGGFQDLRLSPAFRFPSLGCLLRRQSERERLSIADQGVAAISSRRIRLNCCPRATIGNRSLGTCSPGTAGTGWYPAPSQSVRRMLTGTMEYGPKNDERDAVWGRLDQVMARPRPAVEFGSW